MVHCDMSGHTRKTSERRSARADRAKRAHDKPYDGHRGHYSGLIEIYILLILVGPFTNSFIELRKTMGTKRLIQRKMVERSSLKIQSSQG